VYVAVGSEEAIATCAHFSEGIRDEIGLRKVIRVAKDVGEREGVGGKQAMAVEEAMVGKSVTVLLCPGVNDVVVLLVG
jgi:hypothetical protein